MARPDHVAALAGIWRAGGLAAPLALTHPPAEIEFALLQATGMDPAPAP